MRALELGHPGHGGLGERLVAAVLRGEKTATSSLAVQHLGGEPPPRVGEHLALLDAAGRRAGVAVTTRVAVLPLSQAGDDVARAEGEGFACAAHWRAAHTACWREDTDAVRADAGDPGWVLGEHEPVVVEPFRLLGPGELGGGR